MTSVLYDDYKIKVENNYPNNAWTIREKDKFLPITVSTPELVSLDTTLVALHV